MTKNKILKKAILRKLHTPISKKVCHEYNKAKCEADFNKRILQALKFLKEFNKQINLMSCSEKKVLEAQVSFICGKLHSLHLKFTVKEMSIALYFYKRFRENYKILKNLYMLPSRLRINNFVKKIKMKSGIKPEVLTSISKKVSAWSNKNRMCTITFSRVALEPSLKYNNQTVQIKGFAERSNPVAEHTLIVIIKGAVFEWQIPLAYYICDKSTKSFVRDVVIESVNAIVDVGLKPIALCCDQDISYQNVFKEMYEDSRILYNNDNLDGVISINGVKLNIIYDPLHLVKGFRNHFLTKDLVWENKKSAWKDIEEIHLLNGRTKTSLLKLTDSDVVPWKINRFKVKNTMAVFHRDSARLLYFTSAYLKKKEGNFLNPTLKNTADTIMFIEDLYDSFTCPKDNEENKKICTSVTLKSPHVEFWRESIEKLEKIKFINKNGVEVTVSTIKNWITSLKSILRIYEFFKSNNFKILKPKYFLLEHDRSLYFDDFFL